MRFVSGMLAVAFWEYQTSFIEYSFGGNTARRPFGTLMVGQRQANEVELEVVIGHGSGEVSQVLGEWFWQAVLHFSHFGIDFEARRPYFLDFFNPQAYKETKLQEVEIGPGSGEVSNLLGGMVCTGSTAFVYIMELILRLGDCIFWTFSILRLIKNKDAKRNALNRKKCGF